MVSPIRSEAHHQTERPPISGRIHPPLTFTSSTCLPLVTTTILLKVTFNGGYARPPRYEPEDGLYKSPPSPSDGYPTAPPRPPAVNPYCNQQDACTGSPHHEQQQTGTFHGYIGMAQGLPTPPPGSPVGLHGSPEHGMAGDIGVALVLPPGWEAKVLPEGQILYIDHNTQVGAGMGSECGGHAPTACHRSPSIACTGVDKKLCTASSFFAIQWVSRPFSHMYFALWEVKEQDSVVIRSVQSQPHGQEHKRFW